MKKNPLSEDKNNLLWTKLIIFYSAALAKLDEAFYLQKLDRLEELNLNF